MGSMGVLLTLPCPERHEELLRPFPTRVDEDVHPCRGLMMVHSITPKPVKESIPPRGPAACAARRGFRDDEDVVRGTRGDGD